ncbi:LysM peptidoglycan-binding domain-containing protein [Cellulosimicrobium cellulans]|uniref:LysM peptidoglycan-binding domain-containing protein n=1 Tax=Cellulosimicrobium cellulans TaxID=1710 RepID=UPI0019626497|nr:LysM domain-containing protein [Cellulosimicrobium cellulans]MBN0041007.1 LysM peptidoglycan-binding domain-containing protein [Cellulosimicrobium cellulans]
MDRRTAVPGRAGGVTVLLALVLVMGGAVTALALRATHLVGSLPAARPEPYVELLAVALGAVAATWVAASALLGLGCVVARAVGRSWGAGERLLLRAAPAVVRRAARAGVGLTVGAGLALAGGTAHAATAPDADPGVVAVDLGWQTSTTAPEPTGPAQPAPLPTDVPSPAPSASTTPSDQPSPAVTARTGEPPATATGAPTRPSDAPDAPDAPSTDASTPSAVAPARATSPVTATEQRDAVLTVVRDVPADGPREVVVVRGDSLWSIAARHLPDGASDAQVAHAVQRWYAANVGVIGDDPDLVRPGQVLVAPAS